jgi:hypothetical protein
LASSECNGKMVSPEESALRSRRERARTRAGRDDRTTTRIVLHTMRNPIPVRRGISSSTT